MKRGKWMQTAGVLVMTALTVWMGKNGIQPDFIAQDSWHLIRAAVREDGIEVETAGENLMLHAGVKVKADSEEGKGFPADRVRDGITDVSDQRWSSENDWESADHWLEVTFPEVETIGLVRIYWERTNALSYALEYSEDKKVWKQAAVFADRPESLVQDIRLAEPVQTKYLRLHVTDVAREEEDLSLYYQNISVLELEAYEGIEDSFFIKNPEIPEGTGRQLMSSGGQPEETGNIQTAVAFPTVPEGYVLHFSGADYEMLVEGDGTIRDTIADVQTELGFSLEKDGVVRELPGMAVTVPASQRDMEDGSDPGEKSGLPGDYSVAEWLPKGGTYHLTERTRVVILQECEKELLAAAQLFAEELSEYLNRDVELVVAEDGTEEQAAAGKGDIYLSCRLDAEASRLIGGREAYVLYLGTAFEGGTQIFANSAQGVRWGCVSLLSLLEKSEGELPEGIICDFPRYSVRGFGIDVGRRPVSMELLYRIVEEMSKQKMNTLQLHLNDNQIISQSDYDGTAEGARGLYAGFRLESDMKNEDGEGITSTDLYYTKEAFAKFVADAAAYGVDVVPEIDTPAHSLAITKVFPKLGLSRNPESVDQLDLSKPEAVQLVKDLWSEYLADGKPEGENGDVLEDRNVSGAEGIFENCRAVHIGMDEYFGDERSYLSYLKEIAAHVEGLAPDKDIRIWASLSRLEEDYAEVPRSLQLHVWDTEWADPQEMYEEGFSIINSLSSSLYIIPGGGYDWLDQEFLEEKWQPNVFETKERTWTIPAYSSRMLGACYMMWNDWSQMNGETITEEDLFARFAQPLPVIAQKLWGNAFGQSRN